MCGIVGFAAFSAGSITTDRFLASIRALSHRGPDQEGALAWDRRGVVYRDTIPAAGELALGLGHRRLSILDLSESGRQPMSSRSGLWITYNGEIYNYLELRSDLERLGHRFETGTDTEVILAAFEEWGQDCLTRFNGMWAFAIYDPTKRRFFCARDRVGIKPFFYTVNRDAFCFASEVPSLFEIAPMKASFNADRLARCLLIGSPEDADETIYQDVRELPPGHFLWADATTGELRIERYWSLPEEADLELTDEQALDQFSELFEDAVRIRFRSDVPVAVLLSGGLDSSAITVAASRARVPDLRTYTSRFPGFPEIDESVYAAVVAKQCGAEQVFVEPRLENVVDTAPLLTHHQGFPYASMSFFVHWEILERVKREATPVILSGQGGDELMLGYERYLVADVLARRGNPIRSLRALVNGARRSRLGGKRMAAYALYFGLPGLRWQVLRRRARSVFNRELVDRVEALGPLVTGDLRELQHQEITGLQLRHLLRHDDRDTAAHGMETRLPFLDYRLIEFAYRLPWRFKIRHGWTKYLLRRYLDRHLPDSIAWRTNKLGFNAPDRSWLGQVFNRYGDDLLSQPIAGSLLKSPLRPGDMAGLGVGQQTLIYSTLQLAAEHEIAGPL